MKKDEKVVCEFTRSDGVSPGVSPWGAIVRAPADVNVQPRSSFRLNMGIKFSMPGIAFIDPGLAETGLTFSASPIFVTPGEEVVVTVVNKSDVLIRFLEKMAVARVVFIEAPELKPTA
jgi:hypothetical protein